MKSVIVQSGRVEATRGRTVFIPTEATSAVGRDGWLSPDFRIKRVGRGVSVRPTSSISLPVRKSRIGGETVYRRPDEVAVRVKQRS